MLVSIIMPTYNSGKTLDEVLKSISVQKNMDRNEMEVLVVDGGSIDNTLQIASSYPFVRILENKRKLPEIAKHIGFLASKGQYGMYLDSDEILQNSSAFFNRVNAMKRYTDVKNIVSTGMISKTNEKGIVNYANFIADPFSKFVYRFNGFNRMEDISRQYPTEEIEEGKIIDFRIAKNLPLFDAAGNMFEMKFARELYEKTEKKDDFIANVFDKMVSETKTAIIMKDDFVLHIPILTTRKYLKKLKWRVINNIFADKNEGVGFNNRQKQSKYLNIRKYLFILHCVLLLPVIIESIYYVFKNKNIYFLLHIAFSWYTLICIIYYEIRKLFHIEYKSMETYG